MAVVEISGSRILVTGASSGIGRELGTFGLDAYLETKQINLNLAPQKLGWFRGM